MTWLAGWLVGIGVADLVAGAAGRGVAGQRAVVAVGCGTVAAVPAAGIAGGGPVEMLGVAAVVAITAAGWMTARRAVTVRACASVLAVAAALVGLMVAWALAAGSPSGAAGPPTPAQVPPPVLVLGLGVGLCLIGTANVVVRLLLRLADVDSLAAANRLRGGRVIGPLERLLLFGLGLAGAWTAAGLLAAAKSLLRLSELRRGNEIAGPPSSRDERMEFLSEYLLLGSLASWALAVAGVGTVVAGTLAG